jgi:hypothetical protein
MFQNTTGETQPSETQQVKQQVKQQQVKHTVPPPPHVGHPALPFFW